MSINLEGITFKSDRGLQLLKCFAALNNTWCTFNTLTPEWYRITTGEVPADDADDRPLRNAKIAVCKHFNLHCRYDHTDDNGDGCKEIGRHVLCEKSSEMHASGVAKGKHLKHFRLHPELAKRIFIETEVNNDTPLPHHDTESVDMEVNNDTPLPHHDTESDDMEVNDTTLPDHLSDISFDVNQETEDESDQSSPDTNEENSLMESQPLDDSAFLANAAHLEPVDNETTTAVPSGFSWVWELLTKFNHLKNHVEERCGQLFANLKTEISQVRVENDDNIARLNDTAVHLEDQNTSRREETTLLTEQYADILARFNDQNTRNNARFDEVNARLIRNDQVQDQVQPVVRHTRGDISVGPYYADLIKCCYGIPQNAHSNSIRGGDRSITVVMRKEKFLIGKNKTMTTRSGKCHILREHLGEFKEKLKKRFPALVYQDQPYLWLE